VEVRELWYNVMTLRYLLGDHNRASVFGNELLAGIQLPNFDAYFTGDLGVSGVSKIAALMLTSVGEPVLENFDFQKLARAMLSFDCTHQVRRKIQTTGIFFFSDFSRVPVPPALTYLFFDFLNPRE
jgi:hypothetical protein